MTDKHLILLIDCWAEPLSTVAQENDIKGWHDINSQHIKFYEFLSDELSRVDSNTYDIAHLQQKTADVTPILSHYDTIDFPDVVNSHRKHSDHTDADTHVYLAGCHLNRCLEHNSERLHKHEVNNSVVLNWSMALPPDSIELKKKFNYVWFNGNNNIGVIQQSKHPWWRHVLRTAKT